MLKTTLLTGFQPQNFQFKINFVLYTSVLQQFKKIYGYVMWCVYVYYMYIYWSVFCNNDVGVDEEVFLMANKYIAIAIA